MLFGCYAPTAELGAPCTTACPTGQECRAGRCELPGADEPDAASGNGDRDGDGLADDADNCEAVANADQHDEDHDGRGDACDVCPHLVDDGADRDGDGVGDACDPNPDIGGDRIAVFDPLTGPRSAWVELEREWTYASDQLHANGFGTSTYAGLAATTGNSRIVVGGHVTWGAVPPRQISVEFGRPSVYHYCEWYQDSGGPYAGLTRADNGTFDSLDRQNLPALESGAFTVVADERAAAHTASCSMSLAGRVDQVGAPTPDSTAGDRIGLNVEHAGVDLDYVVQIISP